MDFPDFLDSDDIVQYLHLTRHDTEGRLREVYGNDCFELESEPACSEEEEVTLAFSDYEETMEDECYHPSLFVCNEMEVVGGCVDEEATGEVVVRGDVCSK